MSKTNKKALLAKEKQLRKELNEASDVMEKQVVRAAGIALVSGLVAWGVYKLLASSSEDEKSSKKKSKEKKSSFGAAVLSRIIQAMIPLIISGMT
ncbi:MAG: hypothetical protein AAGJ93_08150, partial [Bacteroidota bacterium]